MNDEIEYLRRPLVRATQAGCGHWAPIVHLPRDAKDEGGEKPEAPILAEPSVSPVEQKPD